MASSGIPRATATWLATIPPTLRDKLAGVGLIDAEKRKEEEEQRMAEAEAKANALGSFIDAYIAEREELVKVGRLVADTIRLERATRENLCDHFGADRPLTEITGGHATGFYTYLLTKGGAPVKKCGPKTMLRERTPLAEATARKRVSIASRFFNHAMDLRIIDRNPFAKINKSNIATKRRAFVSEADALKVMAHLPSAEWKVMFALSRWGGLRVPSEVVMLEWSHINWEGKKILVHSPKTQRYEGHETREIPLFPELAKVLSELKAVAPAGKKAVLQMARFWTGGGSVRDPLKTAIKRAGLEVWPRLWHSMRATRQTELEDRFPSHVVCKWMGNSKEVAREHYLTVEPHHFAAGAEPKQVKDVA
ncbi:tyrosine-type recombinase/integrase [Lacipirellula parvula]|uniref:tyrosine-type recombinase/integrase n=1 Tax=Lacipirellula parvula TaxID=2650471 RepID=UPI00156256B8|nr:site-specific integrase [Lacipirellula parvula]